MSQLWRTRIDWLDALLPDGYPVPGSTLVSGPGGSGKPLISLLFSAAWLDAGGRAVFLLTSTDRRYTERVLGLFGYDLDKYKGRFLFADFDLNASQVDQVADDQVRANLLDPHAWDDILKRMDTLDDGGNPGDLVTAAAINLFFFSPTYGDSIHSYIKGLLADPGEKTVHMTINSDVFKPKAKELENAAHNLFMTRMEKPMRLFMQTVRMRGVNFDPSEIEVPISRQMLMEIKQEAERGRRDLIPAISKV